MGHLLLPFRDLFVLPHHSNVAVIEAGIVRLTLQRGGDDTTKGLLHGSPVLDGHVDEREGVVDKVATGDEPEIWSVNGDVNG